MAVNITDEDSMKRLSFSKNSILRKLLPKDTDTSMTSQNISDSVSNLNNYLQNENIYKYIKSEPSLTDRSNKKNSKSTPSISKLKTLENVMAFFWDDEHLLPFMFFKCKH